MRITIQALQNFDTFNLEGSRFMKIRDGIVNITTGVFISFDSFTDILIDGNDVTPRSEYYHVLRGK